MKLIQKQFLKATREFEIVDDVIHVRIKQPFKQEKLTVGLSAINPEPVIDEPYLIFKGRAKPDALLTLLLNKPDTETFNAFVELLKQRVQEENSAIGVIPSASENPGLAANSYDEPPKFDEPGEKRFSNRKTVKPERVEEAIQMLKMYVDDEDIKPLLAALEALKQDPHSESCMMHMENTFNDLGILQGTVLTYAPYISLILSDNPP